MSQDTNKYTKPELRERIKAFWQQVYLIIPEPPKNWEQVSKPCKWSKIIKEQQHIVNENSIEE